MVDRVHVWLDFFNHRLHTAEPITLTTLQRYIDDLYLGTTSPSLLSALDQLEHRYPDIWIQAASTSTACQGLSAETNDDALEYITTTLENIFGHTHALSTEGVLVNYTLVDPTTLQILTFIQKYSEPL